MSLEDFNTIECVMCYHLHLQSVYLEHVAEPNPGVQLCWGEMGLKPFEI